VREKTRDASGEGEGIQKKMEKKIKKTRRRRMNLW
jgi:hypothetical protein